MKKLLIVLISLCIVTAAALAEENVLIDFNDIANNPDATAIDLPSFAQGILTEDEITAISASGIASLGIANWRVELNASAQTVASVASSFTRPASVSRGIYQGETVLGARVQFPTHNHNAWALIEPSFSIPTFSGQGGRQYEGLGVLTNVGAIESISVNVYGLNYPHTLSVILQDSDGVVREHHLGNLEFRGWRTLSWDNPEYIANVRNRALRRYPLYPNTEPTIRLIGFRVYRDGTRDGGDFVTYLKDVSVNYDLAILPREADIEDDLIWELLDDRAFIRNQGEIARYIEALRLEYEEQLRIDASATNANAQ